MTQEDNEFRNDIVALIIAIVASIGFLLLTSCTTTKYVPDTHTEYIMHTDTIYTSHKDSVFVRDSIFITQIFRGDTVWNSREVWHYDTRHLIDTIYKVREDTVLRSDTVSVPVPVKAELSKAQQRYITIGKYASGAAVAIVVLGSIIWWYRRKV